MTKRGQSTNPEYLLKGRRHYEENAEMYKASARRSAFKIEYGATVEEVESLIKLSDGRCMICGKTKRLLLDHDHKARRLRGLLCAPCNTGLGCFYDSLDLLQQAMEYLQRENQ